MRKKKNQSIPLENHQIIKEDSKRERKKQKIFKMPRKQQYGDKSLLINNYFKCKWIKFSHQNT